MEGDGVMSGSLRKAERLSDEYVTKLIRLAADAENRLAEMPDSAYCCGELRSEISKMVGNVEIVRARERFLQKHPDAYDRRVV